MTAIDSGIDSLATVDGLSVTLADGVLSVTIDRPDSLNSVTTQVLAGIADALEGAARDPRVRVVRLGGAGRAGRAARGAGSAVPGCWSQWRGTWVKSSCSGRVWLMQDAG